MAWGVLEMKALLFGVHISDLCFCKLQVEQNWRVQDSLWKGNIKPVRGWSTALYWVYTASVRPPLGSSPSSITLVGSLKVCT